MLQAKSQVACEACKGVFCCSLYYFKSYFATGSHHTLFGILPKKDQFVTKHGDAKNMNYRLIEIYTENMSSAGICII